MENKDAAIVYMVAGLSSRFGGKIKQFAKVGNNEETFIEVSLQQAVNAGFTKIIFIVGEMTEKPFKEMFGSNYRGIPIYYAFQKYDKNTRDKTWGTVDALCSAKRLLNCPFVVCTGDDLYGESSFKKLVNHLKDSDNEAAIGHLMKDTLPEGGLVNRAIFEMDGDYVKKISNAFSISKDNVSGRENEKSCMTIFALHPRVLELLMGGLNNFKIKNKEERKAEYMLHVALSELIEKKAINMKIYDAQEKWIGLTNPEDEEMVREALRKSITL